MHTASHIKVFVPAKNFELSAKFYRELGFNEDWRNDELVQFSLGDCQFLLQNFFDQQLADNLMMQLITPNVDDWWAHIEGMNLAEFDGARARAPEIQPWGQKILYLWGPGGVLWHIAEQV